MTIEERIKISKFLEDLKNKKELKKELKVEVKADLKKQKVEVAK